MEPDSSKIRSELAIVADEISARLERLKSERIVFAESCTAGMIAATMGGVPGISRFLCGSAVTYREATKIAWLNVSPDLIGEHTAESLAVTNEMGILVMQRTPEATLSLAITGHLGPGVDETVNGKVYVAIFQRSRDSVALIGGGQFQLKSANRLGRQTEASFLALQSLNESLEKTEGRRKTSSPSN